MSFFGAMTIGVLALLSYLESCPKPRPVGWAALQWVSERDLPRDKSSELGLIVHEDLAFGLRGFGNGGGALRFKASTDKNI